jgi:cellulose 1,4-beta-cellobiosidase
MRFFPPRGAKNPRLRRGIALASTLVLGTGLAVVVANQANAATGCSVQYTVPAQWGGGFTGSVTITNLGDAISSWTLTWTYADANQKVTQPWNAAVTQSGTAVTAKNLSYNGSIATGANTNFGFNGTWSGSNPIPTAFSLNGNACTGSTTSPTVSPTRTTSPTPSVSPTRTTSPTPTPTPTPTGGTGGPHMVNPYTGARWYVNPDWSSKAAAESGGSRISNQPTAIWLDSINAITAPAGSGYTTSLQTHLNNALSQGATLIQLVIYDLPGRDCAALASNGEIAAGDLTRYQSQYIDPIVALEGQAKYASLRIVNIIEPDSLPNLVTNASGQAGATAACATMLQNGNYVNGVAYALQHLHGVSTNTYNYVDAGHHAWLGWDSNFQPAITLFAQVAQKAGGFNTVDGFITDTANYTPVTEPFYTINTTVNGTSVRQSTWVDFNNYIDELTYAQALRNGLISAGFSSNLGMLIDTARDGWGGAARPTGPSTSTDLNTFVNQSRIDKRIHAGNWCNQSGAGLGARPTANPGPAGIYAYTWIKPPGESDGSSSLVPTGPNNPGGKGFDQMCDPTYTGNARNGNSMTGALPNAPVSGAWFSAQFQQLMQNANPPL